MQLQNKTDAKSAKKLAAVFSFQAFSGKAQAVQYVFILCSLCHTSSISKYFTDVNNISKQTGYALREQKTNCRVARFVQQGLRSAKLEEEKG